MRTESEAFDDGGFIITEEDKIRMASLLALRAALKLEATTELKRRGKSARSMAQEFLNMSGRPTARTVYRRLNEYIVTQLGPDFDKPLS
jgi:hypothetical protein